MEFVFVSQKGNLRQADVGQGDEGRVNGFAEFDLEGRAKYSGIYSCIKLNPRQRGQVIPKTLRLVFTAIVGAVWCDSGKDETKAADVVRRLY